MATLTRRNFILTAAMASAIAATANVAIAEDVDVMNEVDTRAGDDWASQVTEELSCDVLVVGGGLLRHLRCRAGCRER